VGRLGDGQEEVADVRGEVLNILVPDDELADQLVVGDHRVGQERGGGDRRQAPDGEPEVAERVGQGRGPRGLGGVEGDRLVDSLEVGGGAGGADGVGRDEAAALAEVQGGVPLAAVVGGGDENARPDPRRGPQGVVVLGAHLAGGHGGDAAV